MKLATAGMDPTMMATLFSTILCKTSQLRFFMQLGR